jgi:hypothetical protein
MDNKIIDKFLKFIEKNVVPTIKKDFTWLGKAITKDLEKLTKDKKQSKKRRINLSNKLMDI